MTLLTIILIALVIALFTYIALHLMIARADDNENDLGLCVNYYQQWACDKLNIQSVIDNALNLTAFEMTPQLEKEEVAVKMCIIFNITDTTCDDIYGGIGPSIGGKH